MGAMPFLKEQVAGPIRGDNKLSVEAESVEHLVADELTHTLIAQLAQRWGADMTQKMIQGFMDRQRDLLGLGQLVDIGQHAQFQVAESEIQIAATAQFEAEEQQAPPKQEACFIGDHRLEATIRQFIGPKVQLGPEVAERSKKYFSQG